MILATCFGRAKRQGNHSFSWCHPTWCFPFFCIIWSLFTHLVICCGLVFVFSFLFSCLLCYSKREVWSFDFEERLACSLNLVWNFISFSWLLILINFDSHGFCNICVRTTRCSIWLRLCSFVHYFSPLCRNKSIPKFNLIYPCNDEHN